MESMALLRPERLRFVEIRPGEAWPDPQICFDTVEVHCGPPAPYPLVPTPEQILAEAFAIYANIHAGYPGP